MQDQHGFFGKYRGIVTDIEDPDRRQRIRVKITRLDFLTGWAQPCGISRQDYVVPKLGDLVFVEFEGGDIRFPIWQYGPVIFGENVIDSKTFAATNAIGGRRVIGHDSGGAVVIEETAAKNAVLLRSDADHSSTLQLNDVNPSVILKAKQDTVLQTDSLDISAGGSVDIVVAGSEGVAVAGNSDKTVSGDAQNIVSGSDLRVVGKDRRVRTGGKHIIETITLLVQPNAIITLTPEKNQTGTIEMKVKGLGANETSITMSGNSTGSSLLVESHGKAEVKVVRGGMEVTVDQGNVDVTASNGSATVTTSGDITATAQGNVSVTSEADITATSTGKIGLTATTDIEATASGKVNIAASGGTADVTASGNLTASSGAVISLEGGGGSSTKGVVTGIIISDFTGKPLNVPSATVKATS